LIVFLQNISRDDLPREFIQLVQASFHVMHEDDSIFKRHHSDTMERIGLSDAAIL
jgi:hypothetical protein